MALITTFNKSKFNKKNTLTQNTLFKYPYIYNTVDYYIGLGENAITYMKELNDNINSSSLSITHRRIGVNSTMFDLYNPLNLIIDYKVRDVSEYLKDAFFNNVNVYVSASLTSELITPFEFLNFI